jgi:cytoskeletal protein CcmA (bactofilin family)
MLSNFTNKKAEKDGIGPSLAAPQTMPLGVPNGSGLTRAPAPSRGPERGTPSVIGADITIMGNLVSRGEVQIDGEVQGDLHGTNILIGERARITGGIVAEEVVIRGHVMGSVRGRRVMLQSSSHVEGDIFHASLSIEQGAYFEGKSRRSDDPIAGATRPEMPEPGARSEVRFPLTSS